MITNKVATPYSYVLQQKSLRMSYIKSHKQRRLEQNVVSVFLSFLCLEKCNYTFISCNQYITIPIPLYIVHLLWDQLNEAYLWISRVEHRRTNGIHEPAHTRKGKNGRRRCNDDLNNNSHYSSTQTILPHTSPVPHRTNSENMWCQAHSVLAISLFVGSNTR